MTDERLRECANSPVCVAEDEDTAARSAVRTLISGSCAIDVEWAPWRNAAPHRGRGHGRHGSGTTPRNASAASGHGDSEFGIRIMSAPTVPLREHVVDGIFFDRLFYRLNVIHVVLEDGPTE